MEMLEGGPRKRFCTEEHSHLSSQSTRSGEELGASGQAHSGNDPDVFTHFQCQVKFFGHIVSESGLATDPKKIQAVAS